ncbi:MAG: FHA domain-containing protein [Verrucomicrobiota bacterium]
MQTNNLNILLKIRTQDQTFTVEPEGDSCVIGRKDECDVVIKDFSVSHRHAVIEGSADGSLKIRDLSSTNGTYIDGRKVKSSTLELPAKITIGNVNVVVLSADETLTPGGERSAEARAHEGKFVYRRHGKQYGPLSLEEVKKRVLNGELHRTDMIWNDSRQVWMRADSIEGLFDTIEEENITALSELQSTADQTTEAATEGDVTCPHCWHKFNLEDFLFVSRHHLLAGDPVLGPEFQQRFLPSRFTPEGHALDSYGLPCPDRACPRCHLRIPRALTEMPPLFASIVGAAGSGKSYFLTAMIWKLRNILWHKFAMIFADTDAVSNQIINEYEEKLFLNSDPDTPVSLEKTELYGEMYNQLLLDDMETHLPKPFMFSVLPAEHHPDYENALQRMSRTLVLYDNAGEHFEPGMDSVDNPTTQHILYSDTLFFVFDPTKDARFRARCRGSEDPQMAKGARVQRQEILLTEMINRIQKYTGASTRSKSDRPLVIIVPKADIWLHLLGYSVPAEPWTWNAETKTFALDVDTIMSTSFSVRALIEDTSPELVSTAESFARDVIFLPNSALGRSPELDEAGNTLAVRPRDIKPFWITVPMLYHFFSYGLIPAASKIEKQVTELTDIEFSVSGDLIYVNVPGRGLPLQVPFSYSGYTLRCPETGQWFQVPEDLN